MNLFPCLALAAAAGAAPESADLFGNPLARSALVVFFFSLVALFLRFLYGPGGKLREKRWDVLNREFKSGEEEKSLRGQALARVSSLQKELEPLLQREGRAFREYAESFYSGDPRKDELFRLKNEHSHGVFRNAWSIIQGEPELREPRAARAILLAAVYHDIGRFEQLRRYHSFNDEESVDHAVLGAKILADRRFMAKEAPGMRSLVRAAVALHSGAALPARLRAGASSSLALAARAVRDADKLDILRVMQEGLRPGTGGDPAISLNLPDETGKYTPKIARSVLNGKTVLHSDMRYRNDYRLYVCGWPNHLEFPTSLRLLGRSGHLDAILSWLPEDALMDEVRRAVKTRMARR